MNEQTVTKSKANKRENLTQRAYLNSLSSIIDYAGIQLTGFVVSPYLVAGLGSSMFGVWQMLSQITGYAKLADTRASQVLKWNVARKRDLATAEELRSEVTTALAVSVFILPFILVVGGIISWYIPYITKVDAAYVDLTRITCSLLILSLVIGRIFDLFESVLGGMNLGYKRMGFRAGIVVIGGGLKIAVITQGYGLIALSLIQVLIALITGITFYFIVRKYVGWFGFGSTNRAKIISYSQLSGWLMAFTGSKMFLMSSDKIVLGYLIGTVFVTQYTLTMFTSVAIQGIIVAFISGITPGIGKLFGNQEFEKVKQVRQQINNLAWLFAVSTGVAVLLCNRSFITLWVGQGHYAGLYENLFILLISIQGIFFQIDGFIINVTLDLKMKFILSAAASLVTLLLAFLLVEQYQIAGLCASILAGRLILSIGYPIILKKRMQDTSSWLPASQLQAFVTGGLLLVLATYASQWVIIDNWFNLVAAGMLAFLGTSLLFWGAGLRSADRAEIWALASKIKLFRQG
jgi:O-antigen/teichoic acid export membrane protein